MIVRNSRGDELIEIIDVDESVVDIKYSPVNHALAVVKIGNDYLFGLNHWRNEWEIFGGCRKDNESIRECIIRECKEELGIVTDDYEYLGLAKYKMAPGYFNPEWHIEYGGLYGVTLPENALEIIRKHREDRKEIEEVELYINIIGNRNITVTGKNISVIDKKLIEYWK